MMKTLYQITKQEPVYLNDFSDRKDVLTEFALDPWDNSSVKLFKIDNEKVNILFASYGNANYSGDAWVLFERDGNLFEVNAGHCSCHGLEGQWAPEEVILKELENRLINGTFGEDDWSDNNFKEELCKFLGVEFKKNNI